eukprot:scaffold297329_cov27-Tisochrysis_lutea.AAC.1
MFALLRREPWPRVSSSFLLGDTARRHRRGARRRLRRAAPPVPPSPPAFAGIFLAGSLTSPPTCHRIGREARSREALSPSPRPFPPSDPSLILALVRPPRPSCMRSPRLPSQPRGLRERAWVEEGDRGIKTCGKQPEAPLRAAPMVSCGRPHAGAPPSRRDARGEDTVTFAAPLSTSGPPQAVRPPYGGTSPPCHRPDNVIGHATVARAEGRVVQPRWATRGRAGASIEGG